MATDQVARTLQSEARRVLAMHGPGEPIPDRLGHALYWLLFVSGKLTPRRPRRSGKAWNARQRPFRGGSYGPRIA